MINIRQGLFETNSSSTHSLSLVKEEFAKWIVDSFTDFKKVFPDADIELNFDTDTDRYGDTYLVANFKVPIE
jgi:hypothetical protein